MPVTDSYVQLAADGSGKKMETTLLDSGVVDTAGAEIDVHRQRAELVGKSQETLDKLVELGQAQLSCLQAMLAVLNTVSNIGIEAEDFPPDLP